MCFQPLGEPKNAENTRRRLTKRRNREKTLIVGRRNAKNGFPIPWKWGKSLKNGFPTSWKQERQMLQLNSHE